MLNLQAYATYNNRRGCILGFIQDMTPKDCSYRARCSILLRSSHTCEPPGRGKYPDPILPTQSFLIATQRWGTAVAVQRRAVLIVQSLLIRYANTMLPYLTLLQHKVPIQHTNKPDVLVFLSPPTNRQLRPWSHQAPCPRCARYTRRSSSANIQQ